MVTFEETARMEFWLEILKKDGASGASAEEKKLREAGRYRKKQEIAHELAIKEFNRLEKIDVPIRREARETEAHEWSYTQLQLRKWGLFIAALGIIVAIWIAVAGKSS